MSRPAISVENLGKAYRIGLEEEASDTLLGSAARFLKAPGRNLRNLRRLNTANAADDPDVVWALKDVSFEVQPGEVVGVIGRNGAGKSTLLKILSRITEPTTGDVWIRGRVSSLLEVGTGFHPDLSGRDNVYMNGTILGMTKREIDAKFDEIAAFSGVEKFLDTPIKRYSSGMKVRLAFSVAAHLEPEILVIDEVLAVGDAEFQAKCLGKMKDVAGQGRTVLFVSHNMAAVQNLCTTAVLLQRGRQQLRGEAESVVSTYLGEVNKWAGAAIADREDRGGTGTNRIVGLTVLNRDGLPDDIVPARCGFSLRFRLLRPLGADKLSFTIYDEAGGAVTNFVRQPDGSLGDKQSADREFTCSLRENPLRPGAYRVNVAIGQDGKIVDHVEGAGRFEVSQPPTRDRDLPRAGRLGAVSLAHEWAGSEGGESCSEAIAEESARLPAGLAA